MAKKNPKQKLRLTHDERRLAILEAAIPLFADVGFRGTTTKMLAEKTGVSEGLLYQHFPSKEALYEAVQGHLCTRHNPLEELLFGGEPSTEAVVRLNYVFARLLFAPPKNFAYDEIFPRLMLQSLLADGAFARLHREKRFNKIVDFAVLCLAKARAAGDLIPALKNASGADDEARFWFGHYALVMQRLEQIPSTPMSTPPKDIERHINLAVDFVLRGLGISDAALTKYFDAVKFKKAYDAICANAVEGV